MKFLFVFILAFCAFHFTNCSAISRGDEEAELILVSVMFRHGARTTYSFYPNDPNKGNTFYPFGLGGLTNEGKLGEYELGRYLKNIYGEFLGEDYTEDKVYVRSTDVTRTKMSAQLVLAGLFPPSKILQWNEDLMWQPIPVSYKTEAEEDLFHPWGTCPYKKDVISHLPDIKEVQEKYIDPFKESFNFIQENSGKEINHPADMQDFYFILRTENDMDLIMPNWTEQIFPEPTQSIAAQVYGYHNYDARVRQINSGYMLKKILEDSQKKVDGSLSPSDRKIFLYSGHESTLGYMLNALDVYEPHVPPYGSALSFEIYKTEDNAFVKLRYRNDTQATEPVDLKLKDCDYMCPIETFMELQNDLLPSISIQDNCKEDSFKEGNNL